MRDEGGEINWGSVMMILEYKTSNFGITFSWELLRILEDNSHKTIAMLCKDHSGVIWDKLVMTPTLALIEAPLLPSQSMECC